MERSSERADVVVIGAGVAGLAAAGDLRAAGLEVALLEARERLGGRVHTVREPASPLPIELGAEFVHGRPRETWTIAERAGLRLVEVGAERWVADGRTLRPYDAMNDDLADVFAGLDPDRKTDRSFADYLQACRGGDAWRERREMALQFVRGFHGADPARISERAVARATARENALEGDRAYRFVDGYDTLVAALAARAPAPSTGTVVTAVAWREGEVAVTASDRLGERRVVAPRALVTLPIGVMKAAPGTPGAVRFDPPLAAKRAALATIEVGAAVRVVMRFRERVWEGAGAVPNANGADLSRLSFLLARSPAEPLPVFWTGYPIESPVVVAWAGGPDAERLAGTNASELAGRALDTLARLLGAPRERLERQLAAAHAHDWWRDPFARGAYSYLGVGGVDAPADLARPLADTLFFAGEATDDAGDFGTVHGAIATGRRAAAELLAAARSGAGP